MYIYILYIYIYIGCYPEKYTGVIASETPNERSQRSWGPWGRYGERSCNPTSGFQKQSPKTSNYLKVFKA